ncbi:Solute carrier family 25 member 38 [Fasciolopsis buskii]|uniref:Solute carrier family 25 member 38 n=1 Tax=Fasciolopsis buskii TaxID=27845 RepID=A0A8E0S420_9TREM|nr:Solute carrier family 25 member 38 [Fasciolopsis buski]
MQFFYFSVSTGCRKHNPGVVCLTKAVWYTKAPNSLFPPPFQGLSNFWVGTVPSLWRCVPGVGGYFLCLSMLEESTKNYKSYWTGSISFMSPVHSFLSGFIARGLVAVVLDPFLVVKTHAESGLFSDRSMLDAMRRIRTVNGFRGLYGGVMATVVRDCPYSGLYYAAYSGIKSFFAFLFSDNFDSSTTSVLKVALCATLASAFAAAVTQPADVLRVQRQLQLIPTASRETLENSCLPRTRPSWSAVFASVYRTQGLRGLWRGFLLRLLRRTGVGVISWTLYEYMTLV